MVVVEDAVGSAISVVGATATLRDVVVRRVRALSPSVAGGIVAAAHGSDGGVSVRIPASSCGLYGFKPTRARLPDGPYAGEGWGLANAPEGLFFSDGSATLRLLTESARLEISYQIGTYIGAFGEDTAAQTCENRD